jgi:hypothetical protein
VLKSRLRAKYAHLFASPAADRRRARGWAGFAGALVASPFAVIAVAAAGLFPAGVAIALALTAGPAGLLLLTEVNTERPPQRRSGNRLTSRTLTGERTADPSRIERVRLLTYFSRSGVSERVLLVRDAHGVSLGLTSQGLPQGAAPSPRTPAQARTAAAGEQGGAGPSRHAPRPGPPRRPHRRCLAGHGVPTLRLPDRRIHTCRLNPKPLNRTRAAGSGTSGRPPPVARRPVVAVTCR